MRRFYAPLLAAALALPATAQITADGQLTEPAYRLLATDDGGPGLGFGPNNQLNAVYAHADVATGTLHLGIAGQVEQNGNAVIVFLDTREGGYATGDFGRNGAPGAVGSFNSGHTFDAGFRPDYALTVNCNSGGAFNCFYNLYTLSGSTADGGSGGPDVYLGDNNGAVTGTVFPAAGDEDNRTVGFEVALSYSIDGTGTAIQLTRSAASAFALIQSGNGFVSNQFLTPTNAGDGNYGFDAQAFGTKAADPVVLAWRTVDGAPGWRHLGWPVAGTVADFASQNHVQGVAESYPAAGPNVILGWTGSSWLYATSTADPLLPAAGEFWYHYQASDFPAGPSTEFRPLPYTLYAGGRARVADVTYNATSVSTDQFYLMGNPFEHTYDFGAVTSPLAVGPLGYIWDPNAGSAGAYLTVDRTSGSTLDRLIPSMTGVFVELSPVPTAASGGGPSAQFPIGGKLSDGVPLRPSSVTARRLVAFELVRDTPDGPVVEDAVARLAFYPDAVDGPDAFDGTDPPGLAARTADLSFYGDGGSAFIYRAQEARAYTPDAQVDATLSLLVAGLPDGATYRMRWPTMENVPATWALRLLDTQTGAVTDLRAVSEYAFTASATAGRDDRFVVSVVPDGVVASAGAPSLADLGAVRPNPTAGASAVRLSVDRSQSVRADLYDALGRRVATVFEGTVGADGIDLALPTAGLAPGAYVLRVAGETFVASRELTVLR